MRYQRSSVVLFAASLLAAPVAAAAAQPVGAHVPLTLPSVTIVRFPSPQFSNPMARLGPPAESTALRRLPGEEPMLQGDPKTLELEREALGRARSAESDRIRALHGPGQDAMPRP